MKIFQLEDNACIAELVSDVLEEEGIEVDVAYSCKEAREMLAGGKLEQYDALLLDMGLPDGKGTDIVRYAIENGYDKRIVMFSGKDMPFAKKETADLPNIIYLQKPCSPIDNLILALKGEYSD